MLKGGSSIYITQPIQFFHFFILIDATRPRYPLESFSRWDTASDSRQYEENTYVKAFLFKYNDHDFRENNCRINEKNPREKKYVLTFFSFRFLSIQLKALCEKWRATMIISVPDVNPINTSLDPLLVGEYGEDLNFISTFNMFVITNEETADAYDPFREYLLVTLDLYLPNTNFTKHLKKLPKGTPVPSYLRRPPNPYRKYIVNPGPDDPTGAIFHRRFKEYLDIGFNNLLNRLERGITITDPYFYDPQYDQPPVSTITIVLPMEAFDRPDQANL